ncbi:WYL domain-containing protein [Stenotrophomonas geniculata]|uniref:helix-turn-helix transcriptional regulator n=1 Tax=Stenotrophomonas geniculata TaxID=86188 RepID=UPI000F8340D9|nr:WYL domain-containing protein [Stenotrophomonas geniculata]RTY05710.1 WYL domain-containing protein [Stenotrophomonas geniculata]
MTTELSPAQLQRFRFIEAQLLWEGCLQRKDLCAAFGLTLNHVTREISGYRARYPGFLAYDPEVRAWRATESFKPQHASGDAQEYLELLLAYSLAHDPAIMAGAGPALAVEVLPSMQGSISAQVLRPMVSAISQRQGVEIIYQSFSEDGPQRRIIWPQNLVYVLSRWHVRAYDERKARFADFVLSRIKECGASVVAADPSAIDNADAEWKALVEVAIQPRLALSKAQQEIVAQQFGMEETPDGWRWSATMRQCLVKYFLHQHRLDTAPNGGPGVRVALCDPALAERYRFSND